MRFVTYNIQFSQGKDDLYNLERIAGAVRDADVIALQEVVRNVDSVPDRDQPARLGELLDEHHWVYGPNVDLDAAPRVPGRPASIVACSSGTWSLPAGPSCRAGTCCCRGCGASTPTACRAERSRRSSTLPPGLSGAIRFIWTL